jgi:hypothetical protein
MPNVLVLCKLLVAYNCKLDNRFLPYIASMSKGLEDAQLSIHSSLLLCKDCPHCKVIYIDI